MARIALSLKTYQVDSFSIQDWKRGERWGDAVSGEPDIEWTRLPSGGKRPNENAANDGLAYHVGMGRGP